MGMQEKYLTVSFSVMYREKFLTGSIRFLSVKHFETLQD